MGWILINTDTMRVKLYQRFLSCDTIEKAKNNAHLSMAKIVSNDALTALKASDAIDNPAKDRWHGDN